MAPQMFVTPFGQRCLDLGHVASQLVAQSAKPDAIVHKWQIFKAIREARELVGATDRSLAILHALLSFHPETALSGDGEHIVWPSNDHLASRANGMPVSTLRRHIAVLVDCGLIIRRDSPNGKRFARKAQDGKTEQAFGFDLSPIVARADELLGLAQTVQAEKRALRSAKERLSLYRRDITKMIETGVREGVPADWPGHQAAYQSILARLPRGACREIIDAIDAELEVVHTTVRDLLATFVKTEILDANAAQDERHIQDTAPSDIVESRDNQSRSNDRHAHMSAFGEEASPEKPCGGGGVEQDRKAARKAADSEILNITLPLVKQACPDVAGALPDIFASWSSLRRANQPLCRMAYINPQVWEDAKSQLGDDVAIIALAVTVQRAFNGDVKNAGAYMRGLVQRGAKGELFISRSLFAMAKNTLGEAS
ncbi:replication initiation protein RepC [Ancylobacter aquaticus]|uniref:Replication initiation protein RepC n=1 Tax=Ancylobacter aquaticus TaxID=100 RepID=A0A4R1HR27_ANCAQ|nr:plasmid replication protein RepC [Ancylobacter aquaticus]TCK19812.1 replication initiation protein RepC [Ancylobacter aquaticus]